MQANTEASGYVFRSTSAFLYLAATVCSTTLFGIHAYLLAAFRVRGLPLTKYLPAASVISGSAILYAVGGLVSGYFWSGLVLLGFLAILLDVTYIGAFTYVAWANRLGAGRCSRKETTLTSGSGIVGSLGNDQADGLPNKTTACRLETTSLVISGIISLIFMLHIPATIFAVRRQRYFVYQRNQNPIRKSFCRFWKYRASHAKNVPTDKLNPDALPKHATPTDISELYTARADPEPPLRYSAPTMAVKGAPPHADITRPPRAPYQVDQISNGLTIANAVG